MLTIRSHMASFKNVICVSINVCLCATVVLLPSQHHYLLYDRVSRKLLLGKFFNPVSFQLVFSVKDLAMTEQRKSLEETHSLSKCFNLTTMIFFSAFYAMKEKGKDVGY